MIQVRTGIDLVDVPRLSQTIERLGEAFLKRVFLPSEIDYCARMAEPAIHYAARFAAKEAVAKALGTGIGEAVGWLEIEVDRGESGRPRLCLHGNAVAVARGQGVVQMDLSLTHTAQIAAAQVVFLLETGEP